jgi:hypothetical protein
MVRSQVAHINYLGHHSKVHCEDLHYNRSVVDYADWNQNSAHEEDHQSPDYGTTPLDVHFRVDSANLRFQLFALKQVKVFVKV